jgi:CTP-dependent riboflavin kinase
MSADRLDGVVAAGRGLAASRMDDPRVADAVRQVIGFAVVPGTLNVRLHEPLDPKRLTRYLRGSDIDEGWEQRTGQTGYFFAPVIIADRWRGIALQADEPAYPADQIELICEVQLRETLGLADGDPITLTMLP